MAEEAQRTTYIVDLDALPAVRNILLVGTARHVVCGGEGAAETMKILERF